MLALVCGSGDLPRAVSDACDTPPVICALSGFVPAGLSPEITFRLETLGSLIAWLHARGVTRICLCGHIRRPTVDLDAVDPATRAYLPRFAEALQLGDDGALRVVLAIFSDAGFEILAAHEAAPTLLPAIGVPTRAAPGTEIADAARLGDAVLDEMGSADSGQACVIRDGRVVAREDQAGTDAMLAELTRSTGEEGFGDPFSWAMDQADAALGAAADWLSGQGSGAGFLYKGPKPGQDRRADLPVIGPATAAAVARAGLSGIVIEAGGVMVLHRARTIAALDRAGLFLWVRERPG
jgi:DUF1009 family protein